MSNYKSIPESYYAAKAAEAQLLASILIESSDLSRTAINDVRSVVVPSDFLDAGYPDNLHERLYVAMLSCPDPPHQINVAKELHQSGKLQSGDIAYLSKLVSENINCCDYLTFAQAVRAYSESRKGIKQPLVRGYSE